MSEELVAIIYPSLEGAKTPADYEALYPERKLPKDAMVTRYAPSPTGFMHIGGIFVSIINKRLAKQSGGVFYLRLEDTDVARSIPGAVDTIVDSMDRYQVGTDEGLFRNDKGNLDERGDYGPYIQTKRAFIYRDYAIDLLRKGLAYPCFATVEELAAIREQQTAAKVTPGYYGKYAKWRDAKIDAVKAAIESKLPFVLRVRAPDPTGARVDFKDGVKGIISMPVNELDAILLKSDGIPTYHFAHAVDDHLMRTTHVIRGDEWISSVPLHLQLFHTLGFRPPHYAHVPPIQKIEQVEETDEATGEKKTSDSRRKLSKRKDPEANIEFYRELGVPEIATIEYLLNIANSAFEDWRKKNPTLPYEDFPLKLNKLAPGGALSDILKLRSTSQDIVAKMRGEEIYRLGLPWADSYDTELARLMREQSGYTKAALDVERAGKKGNKRIVTWQDIRGQLTYFYDELYAKIDPFDFPENVSEDERKKLLAKLLEAYDPADSRDAWFERVRAVGVAAGYAGEVKQYKATPEAFKGHVGDVSQVLRVALCGTRNTPDLYEVMTVMGPDRVRARIGRFI